MNDRSGFDTATRIAAGDDRTNYDNVAISLHWLTALLVLFQFALAETWDYLPKPTGETMQGLHVSLGVVLTAVILVRVVWRLIPGHQRPSIVSGWVERASKSVHYLLYVLLVVQAALGFMFRWAQAHPVSVFGLFAIPSPLGPSKRRHGTQSATFTTRSAGQSSSSRLDTRLRHSITITRFTTACSGECCRWRTARIETRHSVDLPRVRVPIVSMVALGRGSLAWAATEIRLLTHARGTARPERGPPPPSIRSFD